jgi:hypothetical protein
MDGLVPSTFRAQSRRANRVPLRWVSGLRGAGTAPRRPLISVSGSKMWSYFLSYKWSAHAGTARHSGRTKPRSAA